MSSLYDVVKSVIDADSRERAESILYGSEGIRFNSREYYQKIMANFVKKKELILPKINEKVVFDLDRDINEIWDIVFIGQYTIEYINRCKDELKEKLQNQKELLKQDRERIDMLDKMKDLESQIRSTKDVEQRKALITQKKDLSIAVEKFDKEKQKNLKNIEDDIAKLDKLFSNVREIDIKSRNNSIFNDFSLEENIRNLKESILAVVKIRNSYGHQGEKSSDDIFVLNEELEIDNEKLKLKIPMSYIDGFNKGRIIAKEEDKVIVERTNSIVSPLLEAFDYNIGKIQSFFYNVNPTYLSFLLEKVGYNFSELYKLNVHMFYYEKQTKFLLDNNLSIYDITKLPIFAFFHGDTVIKLRNEGIDVIKLSKYAFQWGDNTIKLKNEGIDVTQLSLVEFQYANDTIKLKNAGIDITRLPSVAFVNVGNTIKLKNAGVDITKLSLCAFRDADEVIKLKNAGIDITKLPDYMKEEIKLKNEGIDVTKLPNVAFVNVDNTIKLRNEGIDVTKLPNVAFVNVDNTIKLKNEGIDVASLPDNAFEYVDNTIKLRNAGIDVASLPDNAFEYVDNTIKLRNAGIDITKLPNVAFLNVDNTIKLRNAGIDITKLPNVAFLNVDNAIKLTNEGIDINQLSDFSFMYGYDKEKDEIVFFNYSEYSESFSLYLDKIINLKKAGIDVTKLPVNYPIDEMNIENIKYILSLNGNNYEVLDGYPIEFFTCPIEIVDEMHKTYNSNISKSIFGIDNPKIIGLLVYMNSVLSEYSKSLDVDSNININCDGFIESSLVDTYKYRNNLLVDMSKDDFVEQFVLGPNEKDILKDYKSSGFGNNAFGEYFDPYTDEYESGYHPSSRNANEIKSYILEKIRNSGLHFRFKLVKDKDGKIVDDKIYLYDEDNNGINNFNIIIDIKYLLDMVREVELELNDKKVNSQNKVR